MTESEAATCRALAATSPEEVVELVRQRLRPELYREVLRRVFRVRRDPETGRTWTATHELVARCNFRGVVTTNYDPGIVDARCASGRRRARRGIARGATRPRWTAGAPRTCFAGATSSDVVRSRGAQPGPRRWCSRRRVAARVRRQAAEGARQAGRFGPPRMDRFQLRRRADRAILRGSPPGRDTDRSGDGTASRRDHGVGPNANGWREPDDPGVLCAHRRAALRRGHRALPVDDTDHSRLGALLPSSRTRGTPRSRRRPRLPRDRASVAPRAPARAGSAPCRRKTRQYAGSTPVTRSSTSKGASTSSRSSSR